ncbi:MAG: disulfide bond formation protein DsbA [Gemmatimonadetes bacterium]|nr:MAG: disulfide bond formation protein DsbA [Gemmatimonadota bacterium]
MTVTIDKADHVRGSGPVTILVYGDYECPYTRALELVIRQLRTRDGDSFRYVYRYFPLREIHPHAQLAAEAAESVYAIGGADAFWRMHDSLFADQYHLEAPDLEERATATGVNMRAYLTAMAAHKYADRVERDVQSGIANGVEGTPSIFINGERYRGKRDEGTLREAIKSNT